MANHIKPNKAKNTKPAHCLLPSLQLREDKIKHDRHPSANKDIVEK